MADQRLVTFLILIFRGSLTQTYRKSLLLAQGGWIPCLAVFATNLYH